jgi:hypothetical protein
MRLHDRRWIGLKLLDARWITADEMQGLKPILQPILNVFGDFLEIFSKRYGATVPIAAAYLKSHERAEKEPAQKDQFTAMLVFPVLDHRFG